MAYEMMSNKCINKLIQFLIFMSVFCLFFDNIPQAFNFGLISIGFSRLLTWYFLFAIFILHAVNQFISVGIKTSIVLLVNSKVFQYIGVFTSVLLLATIIGAFNFEYYDSEYLLGSIQSNKYQAVTVILQNMGLNFSNKNILAVWLIIRVIKESLLTGLYTFGFSWLIAYYIKLDFCKYWEIINKSILCAVSVFMIGVIIDIFYLGGNETARKVLEIITPYIHVIETESEWWPPLLWDSQQVRSFLCEPSRIGNYVAFILPFVWGWYLYYKNNLKNRIISSGFVFLITCTVFLSQARTAYGVFSFLLIGLCILIAIKRKEFLKSGSIIVLLSIVSFFTSVAIIQYENYLRFSSEQSIKVLIERNLVSLNEGKARSNGARYGLLRSGLRVGMSHPVLGVGKGFSTIYILENLDEEALEEREVKLWKSTIKNIGILQYNVDAMNDYVTSFMEIGILGLLLYLFPFMVIIYMLLHEYFKCDDSRQIIILVCILSLTGSLVANMNGSYKTLYTTWIILGISYGALGYLKSQYLK